VARLAEIGGINEGLRGDVEETGETRRCVETPHISRRPTREDPERQPSNANLRDSNPQILPENTSEHRLFLERENSGFSEMVYKQ